MSAITLTGFTEVERIRLRFALSGESLFDGDIFDDSSFELDVSLSDLARLLADVCVVPGAMATKKPRAPKVPVTQRTPKAASAKEAGGGVRM